MQESVHPDFCVNFRFCAVGCIIILGSVATVAAYSMRARSDKALIIAKGIMKCAPQFALPIVHLSSGLITQVVIYCCHQAPIYWKIKLLEGP